MLLHNIRRIVKQLWCFQVIFLLSALMFQGVYAIPSPWVKKLIIKKERVGDKIKTTVRASENRESAKALLDHVSEMAAQTQNVSFCWKGCPQGLEKGSGVGAGFCYKPCDRIEKLDGAGKPYVYGDKTVELGYASDGATLCWRDCPPGSSKTPGFCQWPVGSAGRCYWDLSGVKPSCINRSYSRGTGTSVLYSKCPSGFTDCGLGCAKGGTRGCASKIAEMVVAPLKMTLNIANFVIAAKEGRQGGGGSQAEVSSDPGQSAIKAAIKNAGNAAKDRLLATVRTGAKALAKKISGTLQPLTGAVGEKLTANVKDFYKDKVAGSTLEAMGKAYTASVLKNVSYSIASKAIKEGLKDMDFFKDPAFWIEFVDPVGAYDVYKAFDHPVCALDKEVPSVSPKDMPTEEEVTWHEETYDRETKADAQKSLAAEPTLKTP